MSAAREVRLKADTTKMRHADTTKVGQADATQ
jgi:hypothetical protein